jgi:hypothetical protein
MGGRLTIKRWPRGGRVMVRAIVMARVLEVDFADRAVDGLGTLALKSSQASQLGWRPVSEALAASGELPMHGAVRVLRPVVDEEPVVGVHVEEALAQEGPDQGPRLPRPEAPLLDVAVLEAADIAAG